MVSCSRKRKSVCRSPCAWEVGHGCKKEENVSPESTLRDEIRTQFGSRLFVHIARMIHVSPKDIHIVRKLGKGTRGSVYLVCIGEQLVVLKCAKLNRSNTVEDFETEFEMQKLFYNEKVGVPKPYFYGETQDPHVFFCGMRPDPYTVDFGMMDSLLVQKQSEYFLDVMAASIHALLQFTKSKQLVHGDLHWGNIGFQYTSTLSQTAIIQFPVDIQGKTYLVSPLLIDLGNAEKCTEGNIDEDLFELIRTLYPVFHDTPFHPFNVQHLYPYLLETVDVLGTEITSEDFPTNPTWAVKELKDLERRMKKIIG